MLTFLLQLEEHVISDYIMKIYCAAIPHMSRTSAKFGTDLQLVLQPMVLKPNAQTGLTVSGYSLYPMNQLIALLSVSTCDGSLLMRHCAASDS